MRRGPALFVILALLVICGYGAQRTLAAAWQRLDHYSPPVTGEAAAETGVSGLADRLVLIAVDGLEMTDITFLPSLDWLRRQGASYQLNVPVPAAKTSSAATLLTGAPPEVHGRLFPALTGSDLPDSLLQAAVRAQLTVDGIGSGSLSEQADQNWEFPSSDEELVEASRALVGSQGPDLVIVQVQKPGRDQAAGSGSGQEMTPDKEILAQLDALLVQILEPVDLDTTAVMVVGLPTGRSSLSAGKTQVPLVMAGAGIQSGVQGTASLTDVAPTAAALLGTPTPVISLGQPLLEALTAEGRTADVIVSQYLAVRRSYTQAALNSLGDEAALPDAPETQAEATAYLAQLSQRLQAARTAAWKAAAPARLPYLGGLLAILALYLTLALRRRFGLPLLASLGTYLAGFHLILLVRGGGYLTALTSIESISLRTLAGPALQVALPMAVASVLNGMLCVRKGMRRTRFIGAAALHTALATAAVTAVPAAVLLLIYGWDFPAGLPAPELVAWFLAAAFQIAIIGYLSPIWLLLAVNGARFALQVWPPQETGDSARKADNVIPLQTDRKTGRRRR